MLKWFILFFLLSIFILSTHPHLIHENDTVPIPGGPLHKACLLHRHSPETTMSTFSPFIANSLIYTCRLIKDCILRHLHVVGMKNEHK